MVFRYDYFKSECCKQCGNKYTNMEYQWCKPCQINHLKNNFTKWTSENNQIDDFIQERQLKTDYNDVLFEWIPYNQFSDIEKIGKSDFTTAYLAVWRDGPLYHYKKEWKRNPDQKVFLKYFSQNVIGEFLNKV